MAHFFDLYEYDMLTGKSGKKRTINTHNIVELEELESVKPAKVIRIYLADGRTFDVQKHMGALLDDFRSLGTRY